MQIPQEIQRCVAFLGCDSPSKGGTATEPWWAGTTFLVSVTVDGVKDKVAIYAVTAAHVIEEIKDKSHECVFRLNTATGANPARIPVQNWILHEDSRIDVAVAPFPFVGGVTTHVHIGTESAITPEVIKTEGVGPGDELFFPGLFSRHIGDTENIPIIRSGTIAAMPSGQITTTDKRNRHWRCYGYLAEARSIGGLSGSPVFLYLPEVRGGTLNAGPPRIYWMGLVHGHYNFIDSLDSTESSETDEQSRSLNTGIAIIVSAKHVLEVLDYPLLKNPRDALVGLPIPKASVH
jgi:hypothetical protein